MIKSLISLQFALLFSACMTDILHSPTTIAVESNETKVATIGSRTESVDTTIRREDFESYAPLVDYGSCFMDECRVRITRTTPITKRYYEVVVRNSGDGAAQNIQAGVRIRHTVSESYPQAVNVTEEDYTFMVAAYLAPGGRATAGFDLAETDEVIRLNGITWTDVVEPEQDDDEYEY